MTTAPKFFPRLWTSKLFTGWNYGAQYTHAYRERKFTDDIEFISLAEHNAKMAAVRDKLSALRMLISYYAPHSELEWDDVAEEHVQVEVVNHQYDGETAKQALAILDEILTIGEK